MRKLFVTAPRPQPPLVSLTITTRNEERNIETCLRSIRAQTYPRERMEVIVVDNASTDKTKQLASAFTDKVFDKGPERSAQRNFGMRDKSSGEFVMFLDADMVLAPTVVERCVAAMAVAEGVAALHVPEIVLGRRFFSKVRRFERRFYDGTVVDGARFFRKDAFVRVTGFDEAMSGPEDWDIDKKIKQIGTIGLLEWRPATDDGSGGWPLRSFVEERGVSPSRFGAVIYHNEAEFDLPLYLRKKAYYSRSFDGYVQKWGKSDPDIRRQLGMAYRFFGVFVEDGKWLRLVAHPLLTFGMFSLRFFVGVVFLMRKLG